MDELIYRFIKQYLSIEMQELITDTYVLFEQFEFKDVDDSLINIITSEDFTDPGELQDIFLLEFNSKMDYVISQNGLTLKNDTTIHDKVEVMRSLFQLQHLENYNILYNIITSQESDDETKIATVIAENCCLDVSSILYLIKELEYSLVIRLKEYIEMKLGKEESEVCCDEVMDNIKLFFTYLQSKNKVTLGTQLVKSRAVLGLDFSYYFPFVEEDILALDDDQTSLNFLSIIMISKDGQNKVLEIYREYIVKLLDSLSQAQKIEKLLIINYGYFMKFKQENESLK